MIYFFGGENREESLNKAFSLFENLKKKKPDASFVSVEAKDIDNNFLNEVLQSQGLFEKKLVVFLKEPFTNKEIKKDLILRIGEFKKSENIFVWFDVDLSEKDQQKIISHSEKSLISKSVTKAKEFFNSFAIADAFGKRDKKACWTIFLDAKSKGVSAEEIHGIIFWQAKSILLVMKTDAKDSGLKPFVYSKAKQFSKNFSSIEIESIINTLVKMFHEAHRGNLDFDLSLEEFFLSL